MALSANESAARRARYLKLIALFKIAKGVLLLALGFSLVFLNARPAWLDAISDWSGDELLLEHGRATIWLLNKLQALVSGGKLGATGALALFYAALLFTEGIGVYLQQRWAEYVIVIATGSFVPFEIRHVVHRPSVAAFCLLAVNCAILVFLVMVLKREPHVASAASREPAELARV